MYEKPGPLTLSQVSGARDLLEMTSLNKLADSFIQKHLDKGVGLHLKGRHVDEINNN